MKLVTDNMAGMGILAAGEAPTGPTIASLLAAATGGNGEGDGDACHALGLAYSTAAGDRRDLIEAHKWFNLGALNGHEASAWCRADISAEMNRREIAEAQRRAREWLHGDVRRAA